MGFFNGNKILFIGQNPGVDKNKPQIKLKFEIYQQRYNANFGTWKLGKYILRICRYLRLEQNDISMTNIVKYATENNKQPSDIETNKMLNVLNRQIEYLKPDIIVCIGRLAEYHIKATHDCIYIVHPAAHRYDFSNAKLDAKTILRKMKNA
jgi:uracil-DNA glycosylase family 4